MRGRTVGFESGIRWHKLPGQKWRPKVSFVEPPPAGPADAAVAAEAQGPIRSASVQSLRSNSSSDDSLQTLHSLKAHSQAPSNLSVVSGDSVIGEQGSDQEGIVDPGRMHPSASRPGQAFIGSSWTNILGPATSQSLRRVKRRKDSRPATAVAERRSDATTSGQEEAGQIGNIGWYFGNWGLLSKKDPQKTAEGNWARQIQHRIKQSPAQVLGLSECEAHTQQFLGTPVALDAPDPAQLDVPQEKKRQGFEYLSLRGQEEGTVLVGVRANTAQRIELLEWHRIQHGKYQGKIAYSRTMLVRIWLDDSVGKLGRTHTCRVLHLHRHLAKGIWPGKLQEFWAWLAVAADSMDVLMGDFNMSLFLVIPELRKRGVTIDLAAWFPYKRPDCTPVVDSCGIFFINRPGLYQLNKGLYYLHADSPLGIYWDKDANDAAVAANKPHGTGDFVVMDEDGPGFPFKHYLPSGDDLYPAVRETLTPTLKDENELVRLAKAGSLWKIKEKRLGLKEFKFNNASMAHPTIQNGAHYPICAFTCNPSRRSPERERARAERWSSRRGAEIPTTRTRLNAGQRSLQNAGQGSLQNEGQNSLQNEGQGWRKDGWQGGWQEEGRSRGWLDQGQSSWQDEGQGWRKDGWQGGWQEEGRSRGWQDEGQGWRADGWQAGWRKECWQGGRLDEGQSSWQNEWQSRW